MNRNFPSCIGEDAFEWVGDRNKTPHSLPDVTSSNTRYTCEDFPETCERVFALLRNLFGELQMKSLADYVQAALMLNYNQRNVG